MKKLTRKLIPAFAMLLLSAVLMSTASFAWFTMNNEVTATDMKLTVTAPAALWIAQDKSSRANFSATIELEDDNDKTEFEPVFPVFADGTGIPTFYKPKAEYLAKVDPVSGKIMDGEDEVTFDPTTMGDTTTNGNFIDTFYLLYDGADGDTATLSVSAVITFTGSGTADGIWDALRIAVVFKNEYVLLNPTALGDTGEAEGTFTAKLDAQVDPANASAVTVYAYFDGTDDTCKAQNAFNSHEFSIDLTFTTTA